MTNEREARAHLTAIVSPGDLDLAALIEAIGAEAALEWLRLGEPTLALAPSPTGKPWEALHERYRRAVDLIPDMEGEFAEGSSEGAQVLIPGDSQWPAGLDDLEAPPVALWAAGPMHTGQTVCIEGSRAATRYGVEVAEWIGEHLATQGVHMITSGAYGISAAAIRGALKASPYDCRVTVVLAGGVARPYPSGNTQLLQDLRAAGGTIISEVNPTRNPARWLSLERNRVLAAMTDQVVIVEAGIRSGAMALANQADALGKPIWAVPGQITSAVAAGTNGLIADGYARLLNQVEALTDTL